jgi:hypothetical protein
LMLFFAESSADCLIRELFPGEVNRGVIPLICLLIFRTVQRVIFYIVVRYFGQEQTKSQVNCVAKK